MLLQFNHFVIPHSFMFLFVAGGSYLRKFTDRKITAQSLKFPSNVNVKTMLRLPQRSSLTKTILYQWECSFDFLICLNQIVEICKVSK